MIRQLLHQAAAILAVIVFLVSVAEGVLVLPSRGRPLHGWTDIAFLIATVSLLVASWLLWIDRKQRNLATQSLGRTCAALERSMAERSKLLAESNSLWLALFEAFEERVIIVDADARITQANRFARNQIGYNPSGYMFSDVFPPCDVPAERRCELRLIHHTFLAREPQRGRLLRGGIQCHSLLSVDTYPVLSADGVPEMVIEIARDVTEQTGNDLRHKHQEKMAALGMLAAGFAHDLGNPLASLSSELQLLRHEHDMDRIRDSISVLNTHVERISRTLRDVLNFARRRSNRIGMVDLAHAVHDALRLVERDPRATDISISVDLPAAIPPVLISEDDLLLVLINLVVNAFDAMPNGGQLHFSATRTSGGGVDLAITDTGVGMDYSLVTNATQILFTTKDDNGGTGLGLPLCIDVMETAGGKLTIQSEPHRGTRITLEFPPVTPYGNEDHAHD